MVEEEGRRLVAGFGSTVEDKETQAFIALLNTESLNGTDRGVVATCTAMLDEVLRRLILARLVQGRTAEEMLDGGARAELGAFSSRINAAYVLGLISDNERKRLHIVRKVRNELMHNPTVRMDAPRIADQCAHLFACGGFNIEGDITNRSKFSFAAIQLIAVIGERIPIAAAGRLRAIATFPEPKVT